MTAGVVRSVTTKLLFLAPLLATAALAAGCGGSDSSSQPAAAKTADAVAEATTAPADTSLPTEEPKTTIKSEAGETAEVKMAGSTFAPATIDIKVGDSVTFVNDDEIAHTATSDEFDSGTMDPGASFEFTASKAGTISYICSFHPGMTGTINVT
jgi:plastocyanin